MLDLQKANMWKRISAALFDLILLVIVVVGAAYLLSLVLGYDAYSEQMDEFYTEYEATWGLDFDISAADYEKLSDEERAEYDKAWEAFAADDEVNHVYGMIFNLTLIIVTFSILIAYLLMELMVPLILKNGQTLGKKIFGIALMRRDGVRVQPLLLFVRTVLGKFTVETMLPVLVIIMIYFNIAGLLGPAVVVLLAIVQIALLIATRNRTPIHDLLAQTVAVDMQSQRIFDSPEELLAYKQRLHAEDAAKADY